MVKRYVSIWFRHLKTDWFARHQPELRKVPFVLRTPIHGRMVITSVNQVAHEKGIKTGMVLADARAIQPDLQVMDDVENLPEKLLRRMSEWLIRFSPITSIDLPDGILVDASGCSHLWGGEPSYLKAIHRNLIIRGYDINISIADTIGSAWAVARYGKETQVVPSGENLNALLTLPPEALRLEVETIERLHKLGLHRIGQFVKMPRSSMRRRFGRNFLTRLDMALGNEIETPEPVVPLEPYQERLPCLEPIATAPGIEIALEELLKALCKRLQQEQKGIRSATFNCYRVDGKTEKISISTSRPSHHVQHLFKLFQLKIIHIEPGLGIDLFVLEASKVDDFFSQQGKMWENNGGLEDERLSELLDRLASKVGMETVHRYLPDEHYWPERSYKPASTLDEEKLTVWKNDIRPLQLLSNPERIEVTAPIPDYPPMLFRHQGKLHKIIRADGPERIEQEWWITQGQHRDYYRVEDEDGNRYWLFRLGHYDDKTFQWFIHGYFP